MALHKGIRGTLLAAGLVGAAVLLLPAGLWARLTNDDYLAADALSALLATRVVLAPVVVLLIAAALSGGVRRLICSRAFVFFIPLLFLVQFAVFKWIAGVENSIYVRVVGEDGPVETLGCIAFLLAAALFFRSALRSAPISRLAGLAQISLAIFCLFLGLEEINYGQRIFGFDTPEAIAADNYQESFNLHNLTSLEWYADVLGPNLIVYWAACGWAVAALLQNFSTSRSRYTLSTMVAPWFVASFFLPYGLWAHIDVCCDERAITIWQDQEPAETTLGIAFLAVAIVAWRAARTRK